MKKILRVSGVNNDKCNHVLRATTVQPFLHIPHASRYLCHSAPQCTNVHNRKLLRQETVHAL
jgi:hypothetical protein